MSIEQIVNEMELYWLYLIEQQGELSNCFSIDQLVGQNTFSNRYNICLWIFEGNRESEFGPFPANLDTVLVFPTPDFPNSKILNETTAGVIPDGRLGCSSNPETEHQEA